MKLIVQTMEQYFAQLRYAEQMQREAHEKRIACGARWDGMDGYECRKAKCACLERELSK